MNGLTREGCELSRAHQGALSIVTAFGVFVVDGAVISIVRVVVSIGVRIVHSIFAFAVSVVAVRVVVSIVSVVVRVVRVVTAVADARQSETRRQHTRRNRDWSACARLLDADKGSRSLRSQLGGNVGSNISTFKNLRTLFRS